MGGGGGLGGVVGGIGKGLGGVFTGGLSLVGGKSNPFRRVGDVVGGALTGQAGMIDQGLFGLHNGSSGGGGGGVFQAGGQQSPMDMLVNTGGAPLLANIAMGANIDDTLASFLQVPKDQLSKIEGLDSLKAQLTSVQQNTDMKNKAVQQLVNDFPNYMQELVPKYAGIADQYTQAAAKQALQNVGAKYAAGGQLSSGATMAALSRTGAENAQQNLQYGTQMAGQDFQNKYNEANALRNFQMTMMGQQAQNGFNAVQNALASNQQVNLANAGFQNQQNMQNNLFAQQQTLQNQQNQNQMWQGLGQLGGTVIGGMMGGPMGASIGSQVGSLSGQSGVTSNPRLNLPGLRY